MRWYLVFFISILISFASVLSGHCATISGRVVNTSGIPIAGVNIILQFADSSTLAKSDITIEDGRFSLASIADGGYVLRATAIGYTTYASDPIVVSGGDVTLRDITLQASAKTLQEVTVSAQKPLIEIKADKLIVNVENSIINTGSSVFEVLGRSPGVMIDQSDNVNLKGRPGVTIMMNGKIMPVSGADLANILKGMPSAGIEKIEIISNPGARYDAAGSGGIINIITKKDKTRGLNGILNGSYGQGIYPKANGGGNINYRTAKINLNVNYNYADRRTLNNLGITREFYINNELKTTYTQNNRTYFPVKNHSGSVSLDYNLSGRTVAGCSTTGNSSRFKPLGDNTSQVDSGHTTTYFTTTNHSSDEWANYSINGYVKHTFDSSGRELSVDIDYARYWNQTYQLYTTTYTNALHLPYLPDYIFYGDLSGLTQIRSAKVDYIHPLGRKWRIDAGAKSSYVTADNQPFFYDRSTGADVLDTSKSNHFVYTENINAAYLNTSKDWEKWSAQFGLRGEQTHATGNQKITGQQFTREYTQLFPSLAVQWHTNANNDLGITLSRRIDRPGYRQLNPFKYFLDPTNYRMGNPYLNPTLTYAVEVSHTFRQRFITTFTTSRATNVITETLEADEVFPNISRQTDKNLASMYFYGFSFAYPVKIAKWWQAALNGNLYYSLYKGVLSNTPLNTGRPAFDVNTTSSITLGKGYTAELSGAYQSSMIYGYYDLVPVWYANAGAQKKLLKNKATLKISFTDMFWTNRPGATIVFANFKEVWSSRRDSRVGTLTFVYRLGKTTSGNKRHDSGAEDEKRRVGGAG